MKLFEKSTSARNMIHINEYYITLESESAPAESVCRVDRGGGWDTNAQRLRSAYRDLSLPSYKVSSLGFRLVRP
jgi:formylglycine-generating enzyme required for sulfatase activity